MTLYIIKTKPISLYVEANTRQEAEMIAATRREQMLNLALEHGVVSNKPRS